MTILNETYVEIQNGFTWGVSTKSLIPFIIGIAIIFIMVNFLRFVDWKTTWAAGIVIILFLIAGIFVFMTGFHTKPTYREVPQYEVTLDETVPFKEIYENYDIIDQRGQIFVLRDKGWDNE